MADDYQLSLIYAGSLFSPLYTANYQGFKLTSQLILSQKSQEIPASPWEILQLSPCKSRWEDKQSHTQDLLGGAETGCT